jgi:hypothetical protein
MDFRDYEVAREGDEVVVSGTIREPVNWDFTIRINGDDIPGMLRLGLHRHTLAMALRWAFHRASKAAPAPEAPPVATRPRTPAVSPRAVVSDSGVEAVPAAPRPTPVAAPRPTPVAASRPTPVAASRAPESRAKSGASTPDFGAPRRRGEAFGEPASTTDVIAEGGRR